MAEQLQWSDPAGGATVRADSDFTASGAQQIAPTTGVPMGLLAQFAASATGPWLTCRPTGSAGFITQEPWPAVYDEQPGSWVHAGLQVHGRTAYYARATTWKTSDLNPATKEPNAGATPENWSNAVLLQPAGGKPSVVAATLDDRNAVAGAEG